jgi:two-component system OmpR family sensor kinase
MMQSLRARLIVGLLALAAVGLVLAGAITYAEQRSFLIDRVDQQARSAMPAVSRAFDAQGISDPTAPQRPEPGGGRAAGGDGGLGPAGADANLPPGTYAQLRSANGTVLGTTVLSYTKLAAPKLPATLTPGTIVTVRAKDGSGLRYRAVALPNRFGGGTTVVALPLQDVSQTLDRLLLIEALVIGGVLLLLGVGAWFVVGIGLRPLERMGRTAGAIAGGDMSHRVSPATQKTEIGRLGLSLNAMLSRLEEAFAERQESEDRLRRFLADASHELRTPLASIRGYAELLRIGAAGDAEDQQKAMQRIEDEAARMGVLVEDLLTLARLDEVREPLREDVDLAALARDAVDDARVTAPERAIEVQTDGPAPVVGDPLLLRQVLANLMRNALVHTPAGTAIEVSVRRDGAAQLLEVRDHGPGLPTAAGDPFERFWRAEGGRERGRGGAGLGLAIVAGIVEAHGGRVAAATAPGGGASFTVSLPADLPVPVGAALPGDSQT